MARRIVLPVNDQAFLWWFSTRMIHVYRMQPKDDAVDRIVAIAQNTPYNHKTVFINSMADAGSLTSKHDREFLHALARLCVQKYHEPPEMDFVVRLRAIANATPMTQLST